MTVRHERRRDLETGAEREFWIVDVVFEHADGRQRRVRKVPPIQTRRAAEAYEHQLRQSMLDGTYDREEVPTVATFKDRYIEEHCQANRQKHSTIVQKEGIIEHYLKPRDRLEAARCRLRR